MSYKPVMFDEIQVARPEYSDIAAEFAKFRTLDLGGILGDTLGGVAEGVAESEVGAGEGGFGGVEVRE